MNITHPCLVLPSTQSTKLAGNCFMTIKEERLLMVGSALGLGSDNLGSIPSLCVTYVLCAFPLATFRSRHKMKEVHP